MNYFQTIRDAAILLALVVIPAIFLRANLRDPSELSWLDRALLQVSDIGSCSRNLYLKLSSQTTNAEFPTATRYHSYPYIILTSFH